MTTNSNDFSYLGREGLFQDWNPELIAELEAKAKLLKNCTEDKDLYKKLAAMKKGGNHEAI